MARRRARFRPALGLYELMREPLPEAMPWRLSDQDQFRPCGDDELDEPVGDDDPCGAGHPDEDGHRDPAAGSRWVVEVIDTARRFDAAGLAQTRSAPVATADHGPGLQIIDALVENLQITNRRQHGAMTALKDVDAASELQA
jgi:hypothetical protein